ncbi:MAG: cell wall hydrolase [Xanthobacteraceae bacterium]
MRLSLITAVAIVGTLWSAPAPAVHVPDEGMRLELDPSLATRDIVAESELYCMTLALFFEGGSTGESEEGQRHMGRVIGERARANRRIWGGPTICGVVFHQAKGVCQFSFACLPRARRTARGGARWQMSAAIARDELDGRNNGPDELIRYYMNPELTPLRNVCRFRREFVPVVKAGRHEFFREPTAAELKALSRAEFDACTRYEASLKAKKSKAKKKMAKSGKAKGKVVAARTKKVARTKLARLKK